MTERTTEAIVRNELKNLGYYSENSITIEEQSSKINKITTLLSNASKNNTDNIGRPEFIISNSKDTNFLIVFECKRDINKHERTNGDIKDTDTKNYAVDGVLHYAKHLSSKYTVIAVAVSGKTESELKVSNFLYPRGTSTPKQLINENNVNVDKIIKFEDYCRLASLDPDLDVKLDADLLAFSVKLHNLMRSASISSEDMPLIVSGTLIALMNKAFMEGLKNFTSDDIQEEWARAIKKELKKANIILGKRKSMIATYNEIVGIANEDEGQNKKYPDGIFIEIIESINDNIWQFIHNFDVIGRFYGEFLKYAGDKKSLGIVLTPRHITELFSLITNPGKEDKVLDICAGTGGFLISAMNHMFKTTHSIDEKNKIKKEGLIGVESNHKMFALAASNMILRGDGKASLFNGSCFDVEISNKIDSLKPNIGMLNPPYAQSKSRPELHELYFVKRMMDSLVKGGTGVAIIPVSCVISQHKAKEELLKHHTLTAVMSMPSELFYPVGTVTCIVVFEAHKPHAITNKKTWFGYWRDDGFVKTKNKGRIDLNGNWLSIRDRWIDSYNDKVVIPGESVLVNVSAKDEWVAEAYMETDYSKITQADFEKVVRNYAIFKLLGSQPVVNLLEEGVSND